MKMNALQALSQIIYFLEATQNEIEKLRDEVSRKDEQVKTALFERDRNVEDRIKAETERDALKTGCERLREKVRELEAEIGELEGAVVVDSKEPL